MACSKASLFLLIFQVASASCYYYGNYDGGKSSPQYRPRASRYDNLDRLLSRFDALETERRRTTASPLRREEVPRLVTLPQSHGGTLHEYKKHGLSTPASLVLKSAPLRRHVTEEDSYDEEEEEEDRDFDEEDEERKEDGEDDYEDTTSSNPRGRLHEETWVPARDTPESPHQDESPSSVPGTYSKWKWDHYGTRPAVEDQFRHSTRTAGFKSHSSSDHDVREAVQHALRVNKEGVCRHPRPKVINVNDVYPNSAKKYMPSCTILHQCGDDTGCCRQEGLTCTAKHTRELQLYFYVATLSHNGRFEGSTVEHLTFYNHTECHCKPVQDVMARDSNTEHQDTRSLQRYNRPERDSRNCRCPSLYTVRHLKDGKCLCDCFDKERSCLRAKKGKDYFSHHDRLCITKRECLPPSCDFGSYLPQASRCPRKKEKFAAWGRLIGRQHPI